MNEFLVAYTAIVSTVTLIGLIIHHTRETLPRIYVNGKPITADEVKSVKPGAIRVQHNPKKGSIFIPPTDIEIERNRIIEERKSQGLDTPIDILRERSNEE